MELRLPLTHKTGSLPAGSAWADPVVLGRRAVIGLGVLRPSASRRCGADHRQPAREGRQADDPRTDRKRARTEGGPMMKFRSKKVAGLALAVASITALAACSSSGSSSGNTTAGKVTVPGGIGSVPLAAPGA